MLYLGHIYAQKLFTVYLNKSNWTPYSLETYRQPEYSKKYFKILKF